MTSLVELVCVAHFVGDGLNIPAWRICGGQGWCIFGRNGSGKQLLDRLLVGELSTEAGLVDRGIAIADIALISFESQQAVYEHERRLAATDLLTDDESGTRVADFLPAEKLDDPLIDQLNLRHRLQAFYRELSTGESRKLLVLKALLEDSQLLVCDNPFDGLDPDAVAAIEPSPRGELEITDVNKQYLEWGEYINNLRSSSWLLNFTNNTTSTVRNTSFSHLISTY